MIVLANRPGFPFLGNDFFAAMGMRMCHMNVIALVADVKCSRSRSRLLVVIISITKAKITVTLSRKDVAEALYSHRNVTQTRRNTERQNVRAVSEYPTS